MEITDFPPVGRCARIESGGVEALVTLDVGPRVIRFGRVGGPNHFKVFDDHGPLGSAGCLLYGGHRLWVGPEVAELTYHADNAPIFSEDGTSAVCFQSEPDPQGIVKRIEVAPLPNAGAFQLRHVLKNGSENPVRLFPWCLTVMAAGGECVFPLPHFRAHTEDVLPAAPIVLWGYTRMSDPRWTWGSRVVRLRQSSDPPQKVGALVRQGIAAYSNFGQTFVKRFPFVEGADYPDMGCNFETFTREDMLEVESVGPFCTIGPGEAVEHIEEWRILEGVPSRDDEACGSWLESLAR
jgi:hypothetical protein